MVPKPIEAAFRRCGVWPFKHEVFTASNFTPSQSSSTHHDDPPDYPTRMPSSPLEAVESANDEAEDEEDEPVPSPVVHQAPPATPRKAYTCSHFASPLPHLHSGTPDELELNQSLNDERHLQEHTEVQHQATEAHCTLQAHETDCLILQLNSKPQKKLQHNVQPNTRLLTAPKVQATFEAAELERVEKEQVAAAKAKKELAERQQNLERHHNTAFKTFDSLLTTYKLKDDLRDIAIALALDDTGTIPNLVA
ncbi:hypothetical protein JB92DRAFT_3117406 [Gautieria morchelliformis]|nr:hypothetical protein JB92DRAFT_3117406 [Gautieria morchelliformis]